jgi:hypothetical protein
MQPTDCYMPAEPKNIASVCMSGGIEVDTKPMPEDALVVTSLEGENVDFTVSQKWVEEAGMAVRSGTEDCTVKGNMILGSTEDFDGVCLDGVATATIVVYTDASFDPEQCEACNVQDLTSMGGDYDFCAYFVEIPCEQIAVECGEPSSAPSGSYFPSSAPSESPTKSPAPSASPTSSPSASPSDAPSSSPSASPSASPSSGPTAGPTTSPSASPSGGPSSAPSGSPSSSPSSAPSDSPSSAPSGGPTTSPSSSPSASPSAGPTASPTGYPTMYPTFHPTTLPSSEPTSKPSSSPSASPSGSPSEAPSGSYFPSSAPSDSPTDSHAPSASPSASPSSSPTAGPTTSPSASPSSGPSSSPSDSPSSAPSGGPSSSPSSAPSDSPTASPSASPSSGPTSSPSSSPTASPSGGPTSSPSASPSASPSSTPTNNPTVSMQPTDCYMPAEPKITASLCMTTGGDPMDTIPMPENTIVINNQNFAKDTVDFTVTQNWILEEAGLAIQSGMDSCIIKSNVTFGDSEDVEGECIEGFADVTVVVYMDEEFEPDECEACNVDDLSEMGGEYKFCAYRVELPCEPVSVECGEPSAAPSGSYFPSSAPSESPTDSTKPSASPTSSPSASPTATPTSSPSASPTATPTTLPSSSPTTMSPTGTILAILPPTCPESEPILISNDGETMYPIPPVTITFQNTTHVAFKVENTFGNTVSSVFTEYHTGSFGETECLEEENVEENSLVEIEFVAQCMHNAKISVINIWMTDCSDATPFLDQTDDAEIPECCHAGEQCRTVQYTFKLPCVDLCPDDEVSVTIPPTSLPITGDEGVVRRSLAEKIKNHKHREGTTEEFESLTGEAESNGAEDHFCVVEDYPCGPTSDKVHVCHYSARDGYKTFCVPEPDSDALRFYPKDYCGPCVGGYSSSS